MFKYQSQMKRNIFILLINMVLGPIWSQKLPSVVSSVDLAGYQGT